MYWPIVEHDKPFEGTAWDLRRAGLPERYWHVRLASIPESASHFADVSAWAHNARSMMNEGVGLFVHGKTGQGKTGVAAICVKAALSAWGHAWFSRADEVAGDVIEGRLRPHSDSGYEVSEFWQCANLWAIDDLGTALGGEQTRAILEREIRRRLSEKRAIVITSNQRLEELTSLAEQTRRAIREACKEVRVSGTEFVKDSEHRVEKEFRRLSNG